MKKLLLIIMGSTCLNLIAQRNTLDDEITIVSPYKPQLADAVKKQVRARIPDAATDTLDLTYRIPEEYLRIPYTAPDVRPIALPTEPPEPVPNVFAKVGAGNHALPLLDIYVNSGLHQKKRAESNRTVWSAHGGYINSGIASRQNQKYSELRTSAAVKRYFETVSLSGGLLFNQDIVHFYGYDDSLSFPAGQVRQQFNLLGGDIRLMNSTENDARIAHDTRLVLSYFWNRYGQREINPILSIKIDKAFRSGNHFRVNGLADYTSFSNDSLQARTTIAGLNPAFRYQKDIWYAELGIHFGGDPLGFYFFPDLSFERQLAGKGFVIYAGWNGAPRKNTLQALSSMNPFLAENVSMPVSREQDRYIGFKGNPARGFGYDLKVSSKAVRNLPLFLNDTSDFTRFQVVYDSKALVNQVHAEVTVNDGERLRITASGDFFAFSLNENTDPWHLPTLTGKLRTSYQATRRLGLSLDVFGFNGVKALNEVGQRVSLKGLVDINIGGTFRMAESFFIFANVNNVASMKHERWYRYPGYGFNAVAGLGLSF